MHDAPLGSRIAAKRPSAKPLQHYRNVRRKGGAG
jgi:hypothetical protein